MDRAHGSLTSRQPLPESWVAKIFQAMQGNYGTRFLNQWKTGQMLADGTDAGIKNAMANWAEKLAGFAQKPECIKRALDYLPADPPNLPEFVELCRAAPVEQKPALEYKPTPEDEARAREIAKKVVAALKPKHNDGINRDWATQPRSTMHLKMIFDAAGKDARFRPCIAEMVEQGVCTAEGKLLKRYCATGTWERV